MNRDRAHALSDRENAALDLEVKVGDHVIKVGERVNKIPEHVDVVLAWSAKVTIRNRKGSFVSTRGPTLTSGSPSTSS